MKPQVNIIYNGTATSYKKVMVTQTEPDPKNPAKLVETKKEKETNEVLKSYKLDVQTESH